MTQVHQCCRQVIRASSPGEAKRVQSAAADPAVEASCQKCQDVLKSLSAPPGAHRPGRKFDSTRCRCTQCVPCRLQSTELCLKDFQGRYSQGTCSDLGSCLQRETALRVPADVALPEELTPLAEALEQAQQRVDQVSALREALEWKVCILPFTAGTPLWHADTIIHNVACTGHCFWASNCSNMLMHNPKTAWLRQKFLILILISR